MPETTPEDLAQFDELVAEVMAEWRIPGLALAVVRRDEPPLLHCWGLRDIDTGAPLTPDTDLLGHEILHRDGSCSTGRRGPARLGRAGARGVAGVPAERRGRD